jgi:DNA-binding NarL/FixJ family response regulator
LKGLPRGISCRGAIEQRAHKKLRGFPEQRPLAGEFRVSMGSIPAKAEASPLARSAHFMNDTQPSSDPANLSQSDRKKVQVLLVDDHPLFRKGIAELIRSTGQYEVVGEAATPGEALAKMRETTADVAVIDVSFHGTNGLELTKQMLAEQPNLRVMLLSMHDESLYALRALNSGAQGYVMKKESPDTVLEALRKVADGKIHVSPSIADSLVYRAMRADKPGSNPIDLLSDRELEVLQLFGEGNATHEVAKLLNLSPKTIETHRLHIKEKLGFGTAAEMTRFAVRWVALQNEGGRAPA